METGVYAPNPEPVYQPLTDYTIINVLSKFKVLWFYDVLVRKQSYIIDVPRDLTIILN